MCQHRFGVKCSCGCGIMEFNKIDDGEFDKIVYVSYYVDAFYDKQNSGFLQKLMEKLKFVFTILSGKEYLLYEIVIVDPEEIKKFDCFLGEVSKDLGVKYDQDCNSCTKWKEKND